MYIKTTPPQKKKNSWEQTFKKTPPKDSPSQPSIFRGQAVSFKEGNTTCHLPGDDKTSRLCFRHKSIGPQTLAKWTVGYHENSGLKGGWKLGIEA